MPILLDVLTIIFIVGGVALIGLNFRGSRRRTAGVAPGNIDGPAETAATEYAAGPPHTDIAAFRAQVEECLHQADQSTSPTDREAWLRMGVEWIKLAEDTERRSAGRTDLHIDSHNAASGTS